MKSSRDYGHTFGEAFMLMQYRCGFCGFKERIWNSRDGVTPFCLACPRCNRLEENHVNWQDDVYNPNHQLVKGDRFFRSGTPDEAEAIMRSRIENLRDKYPRSEEDYARMISDARNGKDHEFQNGWPKVDIYQGEEHGT